MSTGSRDNSLSTVLLSVMTDQFGIQFISKMRCPLPLCCVLLNRKGHSSTCTHPTPVPAWLLNANASTKFNPIDVLQGSIYYPGCYVDGHPLQAYGGFAHSFVYVDYYCDKETILHAIPRIAGYEPLFTQEITQEELSPHPQVKVFLRRSDFYPPSLDEPIDEMM